VQGYDTGLCIESAASRRRGHARAVAPRAVTRLCSTGSVRDAQCARYQRQRARLPAGRARPAFLPARPPAGPLTCRPAHLQARSPAGPLNPSPDKAPSAFVHAGPAAFQREESTTPEHAERRVAAVRVWARARKQVMQVGKRARAGRKEGAGCRQGGGGCAMNEAES
jgi:hypothetical protein